MRIIIKFLLKIYFYRIKSNFKDIYFKKSSKILKINFKNIFIHLNILIIIYFYSHIIKGLLIFPKYIQINSEQLIESQNFLFYLFIFHIDGKKVWENGLGTNYLKSSLLDHFQWLGIIEFLSTTRFYSFYVLPYKQFYLSILRT